MTMNTYIDGHLQFLMFGTHILVALGCSLKTNNQQFNNPEVRRKDLFCNSHVIAVKDQGDAQFDVKKQVSSKT